MLPDMVPASLMTLLQAFAPLFTAPSFRTFTALACRFLAQPGKRTVCGMLTGAGLSRLWPHDRAHWFFSRARWNADDLGLTAAVLVVSLLVPAGAPVDVASMTPCSKTREEGLGGIVVPRWLAPGPAKTGYGNNWVIFGIVVRLRFMSRPVAVPVIAKLVIKGSNSRSRLWLARTMAGRLAAALPGRQIRLVADSAYAGGELKGLPAGICWTTRLRKDAALHGLPPARTGRPGRPRVNGTGSRPWRSWPRQRSSPRSPSSATARPKPSPPPWSPACGTPCSARGRLPSSSSATSRAAASASRSSLPTGTAAVLPVVTCG